jgi:hypothetical protein
MGTGSNFSSPKISAYQKEKRNYICNVGNCVARKEVLNIGQENKIQLFANSYFISQR